MLRALYTYIVHFLHTHIRNKLLVSLIFLLFVLRLVKWFINILSVNPLVVEVAQDENREEHQHQDEKEGSHQVDIWSETGQ